MARFREGFSDGTLEGFNAGRGSKRTMVLDGELLRFGKNGSLVIGGVFVIWVFLYVSTIFPYLGYSSRDEIGGVGVRMKTSAGSYGTSRMLLFKGQRAFFEYDIAGNDKAGVRFDVKPYLINGFTEQSQVIRGGQKGRIEFTVPSTGFYNFYHDFPLMEPGSHTRYSVTWGAE